MRCLPAQKSPTPAAVTRYDGDPWLVSDNCCCVRLTGAPARITHPMLPIGDFEVMRLEAAEYEPKAYPMCPVVRIGDMWIQRGYYELIAARWPDATWGANNNAWAPVIAWHDNKLVGTVAPLWNPKTDEHRAEMVEAKEEVERRRQRRAMLRPIDMH